MAFYFRNQGLIQLGQGPGRFRIMAALMAPWRKRLENWKPAAPCSACAARKAQATQFANVADELACESVSRFVRTVGAGVFGTYTMMKKWRV